MGKKDDDSPWRPSGITGIVPPGRKLDQSKRATKWSAAGVKGVALPGSGKNAPVSKKKPTFSKMGGTKQNKKKEIPDPATLKGFLDPIAQFFRENPPHESTVTSLVELIGQSHAPYEIVVAFVILSALVGESADAREKHAWSLERGAKVYFNLCARLGEKVPAPRGLAPKRTDPLFFDMPETAFQLPYAFGTEAFIRLIDLLRGEIAHDRKLIRLGKELYERFISSRTYGGKPLSELLPWNMPAWAPRED